MSYLPESFARRLDNEVIFVVYSTLIATAVWSKNIRFTLFDTSIGAFSVLAIVTCIVFFQCNKCVGFLCPFVLSHHFT